MCTLLTRVYYVSVFSSSSFRSRLFIRPYGLSIPFQVKRNVDQMEPHVLNLEMVESSPSFWNGDNFFLLFFLMLLTPLKEKKLTKAPSLTRNQP